MTALTSLDEYMATYNVTPQQLATFDDVNQDGQFNFADLQFLLHQVLNSGSSSSSPAVQQVGSSSSSSATGASKQVSISSVTSEGYTDPRPMTSSTSHVDTFPKTVSGLRKLISEDLADQPLAFACDCNASASTPRRTVRWKNSLKRGWHNAPIAEDCSLLRNFLGSRLGFVVA